MESVVEQLGRIGLTVYEAKAYLALLNAHLSTALTVSKKSGVPRTRIYAVLESLQNKGWIKIYSGVPLLFKAEDPAAVLTEVKGNFEKFLEAVQITLNDEVTDVKERFVIKKFDIGLEALKQAIGKAKTVEINNATAAFVKKVSVAFSKNAVIRVLLFPGEVQPSNLPQVEFKQAEVAIVSIVRNKEVPSFSITLDESRTFTAFQDPVDSRYIVDEMLYDECQKCFSEWSSLSWHSDEGRGRV